MIANTLITLIIALAIILANLAMLVWIIADTYRMYRFRQELYGKAVNDDE